MDAATLQLIDRAVNDQPQRTVTVLSSLLAVEDAIGYIPPEAVEAVSARMDATVNDVWAVATFYPNFRFSPSHRPPRRGLLGPVLSRDGCNRRNCCGSGSVGPVR